MVEVHVLTLILGISIIFQYTLYMTIYVYRFIWQVERSSTSYSEHRPRRPPPDLPSLLLHRRIVYIGMPVWLWTMVLCERPLSFLLKRMFFSLIFVDIVSILQNSKTNILFLYCLVFLNWNSLMSFSFVSFVVGASSYWACGRPADVPWMDEQERSCLYIYKLDGDRTWWWWTSKWA
jgi:hypothetical protein